VAAGHKNCVQEVILFFNRAALSMRVQDIFSRYDSRRFLGDSIQCVLGQTALVLPTHQQQSEGWDGVSP
jgi:hypothetical protein